MKIFTNNKKAFHNFFVSDMVEAGISLQGCEVKSVRANGISLTESFVVIKNGEMFLKNAYIKPYEMTSSFAPDSYRTRKLLLHKNEIRKFERNMKEKGFTIVPTKVYENNGKVKVEIGLAKGKKLYDKRETLKEKTIKKELDRTLKRG